MLLMPNSFNAGERVFFLGGADLEMRTIRELLTECTVRFFDRQLAWGAKASDYRSEIHQVLSAGATPVLIELRVDLPIDLTQIRVIDHHGDFAGRQSPTSLEQVFALLALPAARWTRWHDLVSANDRGHLRAMHSLNPPATMTEMMHVRELDRAAQGATPEEEAEARRAIEAASVAANGALTVLVLRHTRSSLAADLMEPLLGGIGYQNLLIHTPAGTDFYGEGGIVKALADRFPQDSWCGGDLPERGFWGSSRREAGLEEVITHRLTTFNATP
jgi:hypothetical protein